MVSAPDDETAALGNGFMLWQVTNGWQRAVRGALAPLDLTYVQVVLMSGLQAKLAEGGKVSQAMLAHALGTDAMMTSQVLRTLEAAGYLRRDRDPGDTRARILALTETGRAKLAAALPLLRAVDAEFFEPLGRKQDRFTKAMHRLWKKRRNLGDDRPQPDPLPVKGKRGKTEK